MREFERVIAVRLIWMNSQDANSDIPCVSDAKSLFVFIILRQVVQPQAALPQIANLGRQSSALWTTRTEFAKWVPACNKRILQDPTTKNFKSWICSAEAWWFGTRWWLPTSYFQVVKAVVCSLAPGPTHHQVLFRSFILHLQPETRQKVVCLAIEMARNKREGVNKNQNSYEWSNFFVILVVSKK